MDGMIQLVSNRPLPPSARGQRLTDPDLLLVIAERIRRGNAGGRTGTDEFGLVLGDLRMGGTWLPGVIRAGHYVCTGKWYFWCVHNTKRQVVIELRDEHFSEIVIEVANPDALVAEIRSQIGAANAA